MAGKNQITGGAFQDFEGHVLAYGSLTLQLSHDEQQSVDPGQVVGGLPVTVPLDGQGNIAGTVLIWPNDQLVPANSFYTVNAFRRDGEIAWLSPQNFAIPSSPSPYNIGTAIPTLPPVPGVAGGGLTLQTNGVNNGSQVLLNLKAGSSMSIADDGVGGVTLSSTSVGDGLTHGDPIWEYDSAYNVIREDFLTGLAGSGTAGLGNSWSVKGSPFSVQQHGGFPPYLGLIGFDNSNSVSQQNALTLWNSTTAGAQTYTPGGFTLFENPGWKATFIFKLEGSASASLGQWSTAQKSIYVGLTGPVTANLSAAGVSARPDVFFGIRYDTSATPGTLTLTSVANASAGTTVYTGTITGGANNAYVGLTFTVAGFVTGANNGSFLCTNSAATTLTLVNASGASETHAATATAAGLSDSTYVFEAVQHPTYSVAARRNLQGQTSVTTLAPTPGVWYRLDITCAATGVLGMTLTPSVGTPASHTFTVPQFTLSTSSSGQASVQTNLGRVAYVPGVIGGTTVSTNGVPCVGVGSQITVSGLTGGSSVLNGSQTVTQCDGTNIFWNQTTANVGNNSQSANVLCYPILTPVFILGNDDTAVPVISMRMFCDYFALVWNPILGPTPPGTPSSLKPRYF